MRNLLLGLLCLVALPTLAANEATIRFAAPTQYTDGTNIATGTTITYNLYQAEKGLPKVRVGNVVNGGKVTTGLQAGKEYCWTVTAVINGAESAQSNEGCKSFPFPTPNAVTITVE